MRSALLIAFVASGCFSAPKKNDNPPSANGDGFVYGSPATGGVYRFHDDQVGATCWTTSHGINCLPDAVLRGGSAR